VATAEKQRRLVTANQVTVAQLSPMPLIAWLIYQGQTGWWIAVVIAFFVGLTDYWDGWLARKWGPTTLGAWLDPMADKLLLAAMFVMLTLPGLGLAARIPLWLTVLVISRDIAIILTVAIFNLAVARRTFRPSPLGKVATAVYVITGVVTLYANYDLRFLPLVNVGVYLSAAITIISAAEYLVRMRKASPEV
jgi:cardiolipin synthase